MSLIPRLLLKAMLNLPALHKDPFDRLLLAQALSEGGTLVTGDAQVARYPGPVRKVQVIRRMSCGAATRSLRRGRRRLPSS